jgi:PBSX family phage terminase large subunit
MQHNGNIDLVEIASQLNTSPGSVRGWKSKDKWEQKLNGTFQSDTERSKQMNKVKKKVFDDGTKETMLNENLTHEQRLFCIYYSKIFNATQSYQKAYQCSYDVANSEGYKLLVKPCVKSEIQRLNELKRQQIVANESDLLEYHMRIAFSDIGNYLSFGIKAIEETDGEDIKHTYNINYVDLKESSEIDTQLIQEVKQGRDGISIKLADKYKSLDWLDKYFLINPMDKHRIEFDKKKYELECKKLEPDDKATGIIYRGTPSTMIAPAFAPVVFDIDNKDHREYVFPGGRGSTKSSFISEQVIDLLMKNDGIHALVGRQVADTLRTSVYAQIQWAIDALGLQDEFYCTVSPLEITRKSTGQKIYFRGADDPGKIKSIKVPFGYIGILWLEELDQFAGEEAVRKIEQSVIRGGELAYIFKSFNPPKSANNWANKYIKIPKASRLVTWSTYLDVPRQWLGKPFLDEADFLKEVNPTAYENEYMGIANGTGGAVFDNVIVRAITDDEIKQFDRIYNGVDWGFYPDLYSFVRLQYEPAQHRLYIWQEYTSNKQSNRETADKLLELGITANDLITCDSSENKSVGDYRNYGLLARSAIKGPDSRKYSYKWLQSLKEIIIDNVRCPEAVQEFLNYEYDRDKEGNVISGYPDGNDHVIDAVRYATESIWKKRGQ